MKHNIEKFIVYSDPSYELRKFVPCNGVFLELFAFTKEENIYKLVWSVGYYNFFGCGDTEQLPEEWFSLTWEEFLQKLAEKYEPKTGVTAEYLADRQDLRIFLEFTEQVCNEAGKISFKHR